MAGFGVDLYLYVSLDRDEAFYLIGLYVVGLFTGRAVVYAVMCFRGSLSAKVRCSYFFRGQRRLQYLYRDFLHVDSRTLRGYVRVLYYLHGLCDLNDDLSYGDGSYSFLQFRSYLVYDLRAFLRNYHSVGNVRFLAILGASNGTARGLEGGGA